MTSLPVALARATHVGVPQPGDRRGGRTLVVRVAVAILAVPWKAQGRSAKTGDRPARAGAAADGATSGRRRARNAALGVAPTARAREAARC